jgi:hypothetical protein
MRDKGKEGRKKGEKREEGVKRGKWKKNKNRVTFSSTPHTFPIHTLSMCKHTIVYKSKRPLLEEVEELSVLLTKKLHSRSFRDIFLHYLIILKKVKRK